MQDPFAPFWVCLVTPQCADPALDFLRFDVGKYAATRDENMLVAKEGQSPAKFAVERINYKYVVQQASTLGSVEAQCLLAFRAGCKLIHKADGTPMVASDLTEAPNGVMIAPQTWADDVAEEFGAHAVIEVGNVVLQAAKLKKGQRGPFFFRVG